MPAQFVVRYPALRETSRILVRRGALDRLGRFVRDTTGARRVLLVHDARVGALLGRRALRALRGADVEVTTATVPRGETAKTSKVLDRLWRRLAAAEIGRGDAVVALGGGAVGDVA